MGAGKPSGKSGFDCPPVRRVVRTRNGRLPGGRHPRRSGRERQTARRDSGEIRAAPAAMSPWDRSSAGSTGATSALTASSTGLAGALTASSTGLTGLAGALTSSSTGLTGLAGALTASSTGLTGALSGSDSSLADSAGTAWRSSASVASASPSTSSTRPGGTPGS